ncbi:MAG: hypothetical protein ABEH77_00370, partial [Halobacteriaceae archaeon]
TPPPSTGEAGRNDATTVTLTEFERVTGGGPNQNVQSTDMSGRDVTITVYFTDGSRDTFTASLP